MNDHAGTTADLNLLLSECVRLSSEMLDAARLENWDQVMTLADRRTQLDIETYVQGMNFEEDFACLNYIREIAILNEEVLKLANSARSEICQNIDIVNKQLKMLKAYEKKI